MNSHPVLIAHIFISIHYNKNEVAKMKERLTERHIFAKIYTNKKESLEIQNPNSPRIYISIGEDWREFKALCSLPVQERKKWLHYNSCDLVHPRKLFHCWLHATDPLPMKKEIPPTTFSSVEPLISIFTASYRSGEKIQRPYQSLLNQTYTNWEWIIVDDSGDEDETYNKALQSLADPRVKRYRQNKQNGYIGSTKRYAAGLCTGEILVEVDHDDSLMPDCLEKIVSAFKKNPHCGFAFGESAGVYWDSKHAHWYGWDFGYGYGLYYRVWVHDMNRWQNVVRPADLNWQTIRHLVGLPNHPRAWTRDCYHLLGGHRPGLLVADDYDLLVRTFLSTQYIRIPHLLYIQYRNQGGDNSTFTRNAEIQVLCQELENYYNERINERFQDLKLPSLYGVEYKRIWEVPQSDIRAQTCTMKETDSARTSLLFPILPEMDPDDHSKLHKTLEKGIITQFKEFEVIIIGNPPSNIERYASLAPTGAIRWWPMEAHNTLDDYIRYAELCASCSTREVIYPS